MISLLAFFRRKEGSVEKRINDIHSVLSTSFSHVRKDMEHINNWIGHFIKKHEEHSFEINDIKGRLKRIEDILLNQGEVKEIKQKKDAEFKDDKIDKKEYANIDSFSDEFKELLRNMSITERAIFWTLLNTELKMSYEDLCVVLGKNKSTLRSQMNNLKYKMAGLVKETQENNGIKRFHIDERVKNDLWKKRALQIKQINKKS